MKRYSPIIIMIFWCFTVIKTNAQTFTKKDFKLLLDGKDFTRDSIIPVNELLKVKKVTANFSWIVIKELTVVFTIENSNELNKIYNDPIAVACDGNTICDVVQQNMKKLKPRHLVIIQASKAITKSGDEITIPDLYLKIR